MINYPHPLLKSGLVILDTPGLNALGTEPELTLKMIPSAHAILFLLAMDTGVTKSDMEIWQRYVQSYQTRRIAVLNKIDLLWDELKTEDQIEESIVRQVDQHLPAPGASARPRDRAVGAEGAARAHPRRRRAARAQRHPRPRGPARQRDRARQAGDPALGGGEGNGRDGRGQPAERDGPAHREPGRAAGAGQALGQEPGARQDHAGAAGEGPRHLHRAHGELQDLLRRGAQAGARADGQPGRRAHRRDLRPQQQGHRGQLDHRGPDAQHELAVRRLLAPGREDPRASPARRAASSTRSTRSSRSATASPT